MRLGRMRVHHHLVRGADARDRVADDRHERLHRLQCRGIGLLSTGWHPERAARARRVDVRLTEGDARLADLHREHPVEALESRRVVRERPHLERVVPERARHHRRDRIRIGRDHLADGVTHSGGRHPRQYGGMSEPLGDLRLDPLTREWVNVVGHRQARPNLPSAGCPFCPGGLEAPEPYDVRWFPNRWPAFAPGDAIDTAARRRARHGDAARGRGCRSGAVLTATTTRRSRRCRSPRCARSSTCGPSGRRRSSRGPRWSTCWCSRIGAAKSARPSITRTGRSTATRSSPRRRRARPTRRARTVAGCARRWRASWKQEQRIVCEHGDWIAYVPFAAPYPYGMRFAPRATRRRAPRSRRRLT